MRRGAAQSVVRRRGISEDRQWLLGSWRLPQESDPFMSVIKCPHCGKRTTDAEVASYSGRCINCRTISGDPLPYRCVEGVIPAQAMDQLGATGGSQAVRADADFAVKLLGNGTPPEEVQGELVDRGLDRATAAATVRDLLIQAVYADAAALLNAGVSPGQVAQRLVDKGLDPKAAKAVIDDLVAHAQVRARPEDRAALILQLAGGLLFLAGGGLFMGNVTGLFPTFPFAGFIVMGIGGAIFQAGLRAG
jgi:hypothetical protein